MPALVIRFIDEADWVSRAITWTTSSLWCHCEALSSEGHAWIGAHTGTGVDRRRRLLRRCFFAGENARLDRR